jgi:hypothetical protein
LRLQLVKVPVKVVEVLVKVVEVKCVGERGDQIATRCVLCDQGVDPAAASRSPHECMTSSRRAAATSLDGLR